MYLYYLLSIIIIVLDQLTKWIIVKTMDLYESIPVIMDFFYITSSRNRGAAWGILQGQMIFFYVITLIVIVGVVYFMSRYAKDSIWLGLGLSLILGGAIGNFIDRILRGEVVDFLDFYIFNYHFPIFNVADSSLCVGVVLIIIATLIDERKNRKGMS
ncbi:signal peptidase II [Virgibacillus sp. 179-BFC.A HS]|uniref:Lipoprotein signal peptidase n=1 Tax=Tigheibacillus jepli TaxID=3035914 RepID=A0ABU5CHX7_9BACI|nr:signal peptidase II [Virgibacillus sp. 179-BFC.A HS]MDY0405951.1 signal peptidase II [Virgibacillus sp. 179-BFC.A HS]